MTIQVIRIYKLFGISDLAFLIINFIKTIKATTMLVKNNKSSIVFFIKSIWVDLAAIITYALVIGTLDHNTILREIAIPLPITSIMGTIVGLLLAFRTAQSYDRWWEARKVWGEIVNDSRTLIRQIKQFLPESEPELKELPRDRLSGVLLYRKA